MDGAEDDDNDVGRAGTTIPSGSVVSEDGRVHGFVVEDVEAERSARIRANISVRVGRRRDVKDSARR